MHLDDTDQEQHQHPSQLMSEAEDEALVSAVAKFPALFDRRHEDYRRRNLKVWADLWDSIALALGRDVKTCKNRWKNIRRTYYKIKRKQKMGNCKWPLVGKLAFLDFVASGRKMHLDNMHYHDPHQHQHPSTPHPWMSEAEDEALVSAVGQFPALFDLRHEDYKNRKVRADLWDNIALSLGRDVKTCKDRWRDIKGNYSKIKRKQKMGNCKWPLVGKLAFLDFVASDRKMDHSRFERNVFKLSSFKSSPLTNDGYKRQDMVEHGIISASPSTSKPEARHQELPKQEDDDVDLFMQSIALQLKKLPPQLVARAKLNILTTVNDLQFETSVSDQNLVVNDI